MSSTREAKPGGPQPNPLAPLGQFGQTLGPALRGLRQHAHQIHWRCWPAAGAVLVINALQSGLAFISRRRFRRAVARTPLAGAPLFILGHWRTGTTLLHELLALDPQWAAPTTYECFFPAHFLLTERFVTRHLIRRPRPARRAQDEMTVSLQSPAEDEIALVALGLPSPYQSVMFPNVPGLGDSHFDLLELPAAERERWKQTLAGFIRDLNYHHGRPLVLKSPIHTARLKTLLEIFPNARFIHLVRDPRTVLASTLHMWRALTKILALQQPDHTGLAERAMRNYLRMHTRLREARPLVPAGHFATMRYEDLVRDPAGELRRVYDELGLGDFGPLGQRVGEYFARRQSYRPGRHQLTPEQLAAAEVALREVIEETGYATPDLTVAPPASSSTRTSGAT